MVSNQVDFLWPSAVDMYCIFGGQHFFAGKTFYFFVQCHLLYCRPFALQLLVCDQILGEIVCLESHQKIFGRYFAVDHRPRARDRKQ